MIRKIFLILCLINASQSYSMDLIKNITQNKTSIITLIGLGITATLAATARSFLFGKKQSNIAELRLKEKQCRSRTKITSNKLNDKTESDWLKIIIPETPGDKFSFKELYKSEDNHKNNRITPDIAKKAYDIAKKSHYEENLSYTYYPFVNHTQQTDEYREIAYLRYTDGQKSKTINEPKTSEIKDLRYRETKDWALDTTCINRTEQLKLDYKKRYSHLKVPDEYAIAGQRRKWDLVNPKDARSAEKQLPSYPTTKELAIHYTNFLKSDPKEYPGFSTYLAAQEARK